MIHVEEGSWPTTRRDDLSTQQVQILNHYSFPEASSMSSSSLTASQRKALEQLQDITNGDPDVAVSVLETVDWDVQV